MVTSPATISGLAAACLVACGGKATGADTVPDDRPARRATISWGTTPAASAGAVATRTEVFLGVTEETGKAVSYPVGVYDGTCLILGPLPQYKVLTAIQCTSGGTGFQLQAAGNRSEIVVLRMPIQAGVEPDLLARDHVTSIPVPLGAKIEAAPQ